MGKTKLNAGKKKVESEKSHVSMLETDIKILLSKPQSLGDTQMNGG